MAIVETITTLTGSGVVAEDEGLDDPTLLTQDEESMTQSVIMMEGGWKEEEESVRIMTEERRGHASDSSCLTCLGQFKALLCTQSRDFRSHSESRLLLHKG